MVDVSAVITSVAGRAGYLGEALESLARQTVRPDEVVVVLEGEDGGWEEVLGRFSGVFPIRVLRRFQVSGRAGPAKTLGIRQARGRYVALLDDDDLALEDRIQLQVAFLERHPEYGWVCGRMEVFRRDETLGIWPTDPPGPLDLPRLYEGNRVAYSTVMLTRKAVDVLGGFREDLPLAPDYEAWLRLTAHGVKGFLMDEVLARYRVHSGNVSAREVVRTRAVVHILEVYRDQVDPRTARRTLRRAYRDLARALEREGKGREAARAWWAAWQEARNIRDLARSLARWIFG